MPAPIRDKLRIEAGGFVHRALNLPDVGDLAAEMEVQQDETIFHAPAFQFFERAHDFRRGQAEFRAEAAGRFPASGAAAGELHAHADLRTYANFRRVFRDEMQLRIFFNHGDDLTPHLVGHHRHLDVLVVFKSVADDGSFVVGKRHHREQLGLGAGFQAEFERPPEFEHLFDDLPLLVDFDGINAAITRLDNLCSLMAVSKTL